MAVIRLKRKKNQCARTIFPWETGIAHLQFIFGKRLRVGLIFPGNLVALT
jgi:hypothetical protein